MDSGALVVSNATGSGTGAGAVSVNGGTLGGKGIVSGAVTIGTGSGGGAFLAPAFGTNKQVTLTLQSGLTLQAEATYTYTVKARKNKSRTDLVIANGVTISGATIGLQRKDPGPVKAWPGPDGAQQYEREPNQRNLPQPNRRSGRLGERQ